MSKESFSNRYTLLFIVVISFFAALLLSTTALLLQDKKERAQKLDRRKQLLIAAKILSPEGYFMVKENGAYQPATYQNQKLIPAKGKIQAKEEEIWDIYMKRVMAKVVDDKGNIYSFEEIGISEESYIAKHQDKGYAHLPYKLLYLILDDRKTKADSYVIPIEGFGLWDAIYGYLAISNDGYTVIGTTWYQQSETAGLGADISLPSWQDQFMGKSIFQPNSKGVIDPTTSYIGIKVVKGQVEDIYGDSPKAVNAVDGVTGASQTMRGVMDAYHQTLAPYRPFFIRLYQRKVL